MAFTASDLTNLETAIMKLVNGTRVVECNMDGDLVIYHRTDLQDMMNLRDQIKAEIALAASTDTTNRGRARYAVTTKGY